jgi:hypothetical protein
MSKQSFMRIEDNVKTRLHFSIIDDAIFVRQMEMSSFCCFDDAWFEHGDPTTIHEHTGKMIVDMVLYMRKRYNRADMKLPVTSLYRKPFSLIGKPGSIKTTDYLDLTVDARLAHYGLSFDVSHPMWVKEYGLPEKELNEILAMYNFEAPFSWEPHHYSPKQNITIKRFGLLNTM